MSNTSYETYDFPTSDKRDEVFAWLNENYDRPFLKTGDKSISILLTRSEIYDLNVHSAIIRHGGTKRSKT